MKKIIIIISMWLSSTVIFGQSQEAQQLLLNVEKLAQLKQILRDMYKGYEIVSKGYNNVKDISKGNFDLHKVFLDKFLQVSPAVKQYKRVGDIITYQGKLVKDYKAAFQKFKVLNLFNEREIQYMAGVYDQLIDESLKNIEELTMIVTANRLRMTDEERIKAIDRIFADMEDKLAFLRHFNKGTQVLAMQRVREAKEVKVVEKLYGVK